MKVFFFFVLLLHYLSSFSQDVSHINSDLGLLDSLSNSKEVRIYKGFSYLNQTSLLRIYKNSKENWKAEFYEHWSMTNNEKGFKSKKIDLKPKTEIELVYLKLLLNHILDLPNLDDIDWKLTKKGEIVKVKRKINSKGDYKEMFEFKNRTKKVFLDGIFFKVQISDYKTNEFFFSSHKEYLKLYPDIDELILYSEIVNILSEEFGIWKD
ncbi:hypothetical protein H7U19_01285 [Hyunsoonleella sp. SJ7]|uniref:Uncharacterized protein n=1 Tax=Hyunsoonleella aquatilis TaxID=2762758 RepID=A0A923HBM0_9FLAO|nr:hypothetical protein [Hyunsoonleella aquatilis]MBC3757018.1 hypothetical protein [Hyunsoonleella aquatilis]